MGTDNNSRRIAKPASLRFFAIALILIAFSFISFKATAQETSEPADQIAPASQANETTDNTETQDEENQSPTAYNSDIETHSASNTDSNLESDANDTESENQNADSENQSEPTENSDASQQTDGSTDDSAGQTDTEADAAAEEAKAAAEKRQAELEAIKAMHEKISNLDTSEVSLSRDGKTIIWKVQSNAKPAELAQAITNVLGEKAKAVKSLDSFNTIMIESETPSMEVLDSVIEFVSQVERPERQVFLKVLVAEMQIDQNQNAGNHLQMLDKTVAGMSDLAMSVSSNHSPYSTAVEESVRAGLKLFLLSGRRFRSFLYAQKTNRKFQVISSPQIVATHGKQARVVVGQEVNVRTSTTVSDGVASIEYGKIPIGLTLKVIPYIHSNGMISMEITQSISSLDTYDQERNLASTFERLITTSANVPVGQTVVLGGIISRRNEDNRAGVPILSRIPFLKKIFDRKEKSEQQIELLVFITPEIANTSQQQQKITSDALDFSSDKMQFKKQVRRQISNVEIKPAKKIETSALKPSDKNADTKPVTTARSKPEIAADSKAASDEAVQPAKSPTMAELLKASKARKAKLRQNP